MPAPWPSRCGGGQRRILEAQLAPEWLPEVHITNVRVGDGSADGFQRH
jgi:hypothetical protein